MLVSSWEDVVVTVVWGVDRESDQSALVGVEDGSESVEERV